MSATRIPVALPLDATSPALKTGMTPKSGTTPRPSGTTPGAMPTPTTAFLAGIGQSPLATFQMGTYPTPNTAQQLMNMPTNGPGPGPATVARMGGASSTSPFPFPFAFQGQPTPVNRMRAPSTAGSIKGNAQGAVNIDDVVRVLGEVVKELERLERVWGDWEQARSRVPSKAPDALRPEALLQDLQASIPFLLSLSVSQAFGALPLPLSLASQSGALPTVPELIQYLEAAAQEAFQGREQVKNASKEVLEVLGGK